jgi:hypothetical protein
MSAYLFTNKDNFKVDILSTEYQNIGSKGTTEWGWDVVPLLKLVIIYLNC